MPNHHKALKLIYPGQANAYPGFFYAIKWNDVTIKTTNVIASLHNKTAPKPAQYFTLSGIPLQKTPGKGFYIIRQGTKTSKCMA